MKRKSFDLSCRWASHLWNASAADENLTKKKGKSYFDFSFSLFMIFRCPFSFPPLACPDPTPWTQLRVDGGRKIDFGDVSRLIDTRKHKVMTYKKFIHFSSLPKHSFLVKSSKTSWKVDSTGEISLAEVWRGGEVFTPHARSLHCSFMVFHNDNFRLATEKRKNVFQKFQSFSEEK
jgi:hypothetical protein